MPAKIFNNKMQATSTNYDTQIRGENLVTWLRVPITLAVFLLFIGYLTHASEQTRTAIYICFGALLCWSIFGFGIRSVASRGYYKPWLSFFSISFDIAMVLLSQIAISTAQPLGLVTGSVTGYYFLVIALAALRKRRDFVVFAGVSAAVVHLVYSIIIFYIYLPSGYALSDINGYPVEYTLLDEAARAAIMVIIAWIVGRVTMDLINSERHYHDLFEQVPDGVLIASEGNEILAANHRFANMVGRSISDITGQNMIDFFDSGAGDITKLPLSTEPGEGPTMLFRFDGEKVPVHIVASTINYKGVNCVEMSIRDISDTVELEAQLIQLQKMETLGRLAGGLAHDFNNILGGVLGAASLAERSVSRLEGGIERDKLRQQISIIKNCGGRASDVVSRLMTLSRRKSIATVPLDLTKVIEDVATICRNTFGDGIDLVVDAPETQAVADGDETSITQALLNLCINSRDAMPDGGTLYIRLTIHVANEQTASLHPVTHPGDVYWLIEVEDTGTGIEDDIMDKVFDPFFTTKPVGEGTGLGLSMVYKIATEHRGFVEVDSIPGKGASFKIYLRQAIAKFVCEHPVDQTLPRGTGTILVIDDEEIVRTSVCSMLMELGYDLESAPGGEEALGILESRDFKIDLVILDVIMPRMDGVAVLRKIRKRDKNINVLIMSGFGTEERVEEIEELGTNGMLNKPFNIRDLAYGVVRAMSSGKQPDARKNRLSF